MNATFLSLLLAEIDPQIRGRTIAAISSPEPDVLLLSVAGVRERLVLDASAGAPRVGWEAAGSDDRARTGDAPSAASALAEAARPFVAGERVETIEQPDGDRWVHLRADARWRVVWERLGRRANVLVLDGDTIAACLRQYLPGPHVSRVIAVGETYPPAPAAGAPQEVEAIDIGLGPGIAPSNAAQRLRGARRPCVVYPDAASDAVRASSPADPLPRMPRLTWLEPDADTLARARLAGARVETHDTFAGASAAWGAAARDVLERARILGELLAHWKLVERRARHALDAVRGDLENAGRHAEYRAYGEALVASFRLIERGRSEARVPDPREPTTTLVIPLDPAKSPGENAERYFREARRAERSLDLLAARRARLERDLEKAAAERRRCEEADTGELAGATHAVLRRKLREAGLRPEPDRGGRAAAGRRGPAEEHRGRGRSKGAALLERARLHRYEVTGGFTVLVGKSNEDNDILTHKIARPWDLWFHSGQSAGSHVVLVKGGQRASPPKEALLEAAALAAYFSKSRTAGLVPVVMTEKRYVRKPRKSPPGLATCERERTLFVRPNALAEKRVVREDPAV
jgi:predicted ribosome quality control (RQC) complex YloA/Tae2 family protein